MLKHFSSLLSKSAAFIGACLRRSRTHFLHYWHKSILYRITVVACGLLIIAVASMYGVARWYIAQNNAKPEVVGTSFIPAYAESLGLNSQETLDALLTDMDVKHLRLVSYWDQLEPSPGTYDFSLLDWQFKKAEAANAKVSLSIGLRQPRWPECHMPAWAVDRPKEDWQPRLEQFIVAVVNRYKDSPSLESYQLENEYFLKAFGICPDFSRDRLVSEYTVVKKADPHHPVIISRSNNALGSPINDPKPDAYGVSIYKRVWFVPLGRYLEYPFPAWFYGFLAGTQKIIDGRDMIIHELQAEAWPPNGQSITQTSLSEQNKSFNANYFVDRIEYGKATGMREMYLWGSEYWYYRKVIMHDPSLWNVAKSAFKTNQ